MQYFQAVSYCCSNSDAFVETRNTEHFIMKR
jgi:hypothetical protein